MHGLLLAVCIVATAILVRSGGQVVSRGVRRTEVLRRRVLTSRDELRTLLAVPSMRVKRLPIRPQQTISGQIVPLESASPPAKYVRKLRKKQLASAQLKKLLGDHFDEEWMSETKPEVLVIEPTVDDYYDQSLEVDRLHADLTRLNITQDLEETLGLDGNSSVIQLVESWLVSRSLCPIRFVWEDVGPLFWPPWIKRGECIDDYHRTCSWPPGMHCMPSEVRAVHLLRWHCRPQGVREKRDNNEDSTLPEDEEYVTPADQQERQTIIIGALEDEGEIPVTALPQRRRQPTKRRTRVRCQWLKVPYPVTSSCYCSC